jgi:hypothetical protein
MAVTGVNPDGSERARVDQLPRQAQLAHWPTTTVEDAHASARHGYMDDGRDRAAARPQKAALTGHPGTTLLDAARMAGWPSPCVPNGGRSVPPETMDATGKTPDGKKHAASLEHAVKFAGWPTPMAGTPAQAGYNEAGNTDSSRRTAALCGAEYAGAGIQESPAWTGGPARLTCSGALVTGSSAATASGGQLNPAHSRWLMGLPPVWDACGVTAMPSSRPSRRRSSTPTSRKKRSP